MLYISKIDDYLKILNDELKGFVVKILVNVFNL